MRHHDTTFATAGLPRVGNALVTITARDSNGFLHVYGEFETSVGAFTRALETMRIDAPDSTAADIEVVDVVALAGDSDAGRKTRRPFARGRVAEIRPS